MEQFNEKGEAICQICGIAFNLLTPAHLKIHSTTVKEYKEKYPGCPMSSEAFKAKQNYRYEKIFKEPEKEVQIEEIQEFSLDKIPEVKKESNTNDFFQDIKKFVKDNIVTEYPDPNKIIPKGKIKILNLFLSYFPDVKNSFSIEKYSLSGFLEYKLITDICIPSIKIDIEFPDSFWHNRDVPKHNRDGKLKDDGWTIIDIFGVQPSIEEIEEIIKTRILVKK